MLYCCDFSDCGEDRLVPNFTRDSTRQSARLLLLLSHNGGSLLEVQNYLVKKAKSKRFNPLPKEWEETMEETTMHVEKQTPEADRFSALFCAEHRQIRDLLLEFVQAYQNHEKNRISELLSDIACYLGPHFCYEEETLYPALVYFFGPEYVRELFGAHDFLNALGTGELTNSRRSQTWQTYGDGLCC